MNRRFTKPETGMIDTAHAKAQLCLLLVNMPDERLAAATVDSLANISRAPRKFVAERLLGEQLRRSAGR